MNTRERLRQIRHQYTHGKSVERAMPDAGRRDFGIDGKLAAELRAWKFQQKPERRQADSLVIATVRSGPVTVADASEPRPDKNQTNGSV